MSLRAILGKNVRTLRLRQRMTQEELAGRIGVDQYYVSGLEAGHRNLTLNTLDKVAQALAVKAPELLMDRPRIAPKRKIGSSRKKIN